MAIPVIHKLNALLELADHTLPSVRPEFADLHARALAAIRQIGQYEFWDEHDYVSADQIEPTPDTDAAPELPLETTTDLRRL